MAIPQGALASDFVTPDAEWITPDDTAYAPLTNWEAGPVALDDPSEGLFYQDWVFTYNGGTGDITATPQTVGTPSVILTVAGVKAISCTFDQNARPTVAYQTATSTYLWWYDSELPGRDTVDLTSAVLGCTIYMDDKRQTQNVANDILLWTTTSIGVDFDLNMYRQRDRFLTKYVMGQVPYAYIRRSGMHKELRGKLQLTEAPAFY